MNIEWYLIICVVGGVLMINGLRKLRRRDLFTPSPLVGWLFVLGTFAFQLFQLDLFVNDLHGSRVGKSSRTLKRKVKEESARSPCS